MDPTSRRTLGETGLRLTQLGFGGAALGGLYAAVGADGAADALRAGWSEGVRYFDTSPWYGRGQSEVRVGQVLKSHPRDEFILSTKVGRWLRPTTRTVVDMWHGASREEPVFDYTFDGVLKSFHQSQERLGIEHVDILFIHDLDHEHFPDEREFSSRFRDLEMSGWRALLELREAGKIGAIGLGVNELGIIPTFLDAFPIQVVLLAMPYTLLDQSALVDELPLCMEAGVGVVIGAPFASGILATGAVDGAMYGYGIASAKILERTKGLADVCREFQVPLRAAALQFPLGHPAVLSVIPGVRSAEEAHAAVEAMRHPIPRELWVEMIRRGLIRPDSPLP